MTETIEKSSAPEVLRSRITGGELTEPADVELIRMTMLVILDGLEDGLLENAERAAESLVHQLRLRRIKQFADDSGVVSQN